MVAGALGLAALVVLAVLIHANLPPSTIATGTPANAAMVRETPPTSTPRPPSQEEVRNFQVADAMRAGGAAYAQGDLKGALAQFEAAVAAAPDDPEARNNLAQLLVRLGRAQAALPHFDEAVRIDPQKWNYRFNRARVYGQLDRWDDAVREYRSAAQLFPEDYATHFNLGLALMRVKQYPEAAQSLETAIAMAPGEPSFFVPLGTAYVGAQRPDLARATFEKYLSLFPADADAGKVKDLLQAMTEAGQ